jgi:hypothetical protein
MQVLRQWAREKQVGSRVSAFGGKGPAALEWSAVLPRCSNRPSKARARMGSPTAISEATFSLTDGAVMSALLRSEGRAPSESRAPRPTYPSLPARHSEQPRAVLETRPCLHVGHESCMSDDVSDDVSHDVSHDVGFDVGFGPPYRQAFGRMHEPASPVRPILDWLKRCALLCSGSPAGARRAPAGGPRRPRWRGASRPPLGARVWSSASRVRSRAPEDVSLVPPGAVQPFRRAAGDRGPSRRPRPTTVFSPYSSENPNDKECA